ncbi:hypothetical protein O4J56_24350 [Nocardiopsis sp. RSe5-2]|uniref:Uncharacterized protein n=1 Tax=Nocardiopsis endophytica TaxID=3018445 RepID=A0ABT4UBF9_9ACTN|nr:hypothetical protein [Nocardiopsis endophytica]MDA2813799.1 hypothetical protein [Nocardiopsis endophytica]
MRAQRTPDSVSDRSAARRALAAEHGWTYTARDTRALRGWPRTALPPGPLGRVVDEVSGVHRGRAFRLFDYLYGPGPHTLVVHALELPARLPYAYVQDREGGAHDLYAEAADRRFALALLDDAVRADIRRAGIADLVVDGARLICTGGGPAPGAVLERLDALVGLVGHIPDEVWSQWGRAPDA